MAVAALVACGGDAPPDAPATPVLSAAACGLPTDARSVNWPADAPHFADRLAVRRLLLDGRYDTLDAVLNAYRDSTWHDPRLEDALVDVFDAFDVADPALRQPIDAYVAAQPGSAAPWLVRATYRVALGERARGADFAARTSQTQFQRMGDALQAAASDVDSARARAPCHYIIYRVSLNILTHVGDTGMSRQVLDEALRTYPSSFRLRAQHLLKLRPRWGGSHAAMDAFAAEQAQPATDNPRLASLRGFTAWDRASLADIAGDVATAQREYGRAMLETDFYAMLERFGRFQYARQQYADAVRNLEAAHRGNPGDAGILYNLSRARYRMARELPTEQRAGPMRAAVAEMQRAGALDPTDDDIAEWLTFYQEQVQPWLDAGR